MNTNLVDEEKVTKLLDAIDAFFSVPTSVAVLVSKQPDELKGVYTELMSAVYNLDMTRAPIKKSRTMQDCIEGKPING